MPFNRQTCSRCGGHWTWPPDTLCRKCQRELSNQPAPKPIIVPSTRPDRDDPRYQAVMNNGEYA